MFCRRAVPLSQTSSDLLEDPAIPQNSTSALCVASAPRHVEVRRVACIAQIWLTSPSSPDLHCRARPLPKSGFRRTFREVSCHPERPAIFGERLMCHYRLGMELVRMAWRSGRHVVTLRMADSTRFGVRVRSMARPTLHVSMARPTLHLDESILADGVDA